jgi:peroxiredoxin
MKKLTLLFVSIFITFIGFSQTDESTPTGLLKGDVAPNFSAKNQNGETVELKQLLAKGEVVVVFYRGQWCPYCNKQMGSISDSLSFITAKGASILTITAETSENIAKTIKKTKANYSILEDKGLVIMKNYKVNFTVDNNTIAKYKKYGIDFEKANGANGANLPVPATYVIGKDGKIKYVFFNPDYTKRPSVKEILDNL